MNSLLPDTALWLRPEQAHEAFRKGTGAGIRIAVVDSGVDYSHPDLQSLVVADNLVLSEREEHEPIRRDEGPYDPHGHGTAIASIIHEVAPEAIIGSFRIFEGSDTKAHGRVIREGVEKALALGYDIINCSFGIGEQASGQYKYITRNKSWVDKAFFSGRHLVAACNNSDDTLTEWPAHFTSVVTVDGIHCGADELFWRRGDVAYRRAKGSSPEEAWLVSKGECNAARSGFAELGAKGVDVDVAWTGHTRNKVTGSSYAAPRVAGWMARILSVYPHVDPAQMKGLLRLLACEREYFRLQSGRELARATSDSFKPRARSGVGGG